MKKFIKIVFYSALAIFIVGMVTVFLCSCGSSKSSLKTETSVESISDKEKKELSVINEQTKVTEAENTIEVTELETIVYDTTTAGPDGTYPILSITKVNATKGQVKSKETEIAKEEKSDIIENVNEFIKESVKTDQVKEIKETSVFSEWAFFVFGLLTSLALLIYIKK